MNLSEQTIAKAIKSESGELAWKREYVFDVIDEILILGFSILGGEVWAIINDNKIEPPLVRINDTQIAVGIIKGKDGIDYVYSWSLQRSKNEDWEDYIKRTAQESKDLIIMFNAEEEVHEMYNTNIYYNLVFVDINEYETLGS